MILEKKLSLRALLETTSPKLSYKFWKIKRIGSKFLYQNSNKTRLSELNLLLHQSDEQESDVHAFIEEIRKYAAIKELDEVVLNRLIKKIMIGEVQKVDGQKIQEVKIIYNFVGEISA